MNAATATATATATTTANATATATTPAPPQRVLKEAGDSWGEWAETREHQHNHNHSSVHTLGNIMLCV